VFLQEHCGKAEKGRGQVIGSKPALFGRLLISMA
jgi:hypothetical protein